MKAGRAEYFFNVSDLKGRKKDLLHVSVPGDIDPAEVSVPHNFSRLPLSPPPPPFEGTRLGNFIMNVISMTEAIYGTPRW